jgi:TetR/AcrR family transcriptional regulator
MDDKTTESQIFQAALKIFHRKGLTGARMQEIADEAGINKSMLHYYYRSKEKLFNEVFTSSIAEFSGKFDSILNAENSSWEDKIRDSCHLLSDFMTTNPDLALFVINEMNQQPDCISAVLRTDMGLMHTRFFTQLKTAMKKGEIRKLDPMQLFVSLVSEILYPFVSGPLLRRKTSQTTEEWLKLLENRKQFVADLLITYLKTK